MFHGKGVFAVLFYTSLYSKTTGGVALVFAALAAKGKSKIRNLEVKSLHKKQENLTTENTEITEIFLKVFSVDSVRSVVKSFLVSACPS